MIQDADELGQGNGIGKRFKGQNKENNFDFVKVEVASREWPQVNQ